MKYTMRERPDHVYELFRYDEPAEPHDNAHLQFWLELEDHHQKLKELVALADSGQYTSSRWRKALDAARQLLEETKQIEGVQTNDSG